ncbi:hypothetical protein PROFUN_12023 [Planoprotostelium fungivorum]|uniref:Uncharacterized protein n=1 Tax=Planoprotostelium fungivorum TaxID=1890364 RepID=A0A2P6MRH5_9EUKA|nr:hypothetical protein PROFUN_12023 [Planoprotostelium fungivorum]
MLRSVESGNHSNTTDCSTVYILHYPSMSGLSSQVQCLAIYNTTTLDILKTRLLLVDDHSDQITDCSRVDFEKFAIGVVFSVQGLENVEAAAMIRMPDFLIATLAAEDGSSCDDSRGNYRDLYFPDVYMSYWWCRSSHAGRGSSIAITALKDKTG